MPGVQIVIADDDPVLRQVVRGLLAGRGHDIVAEVESASAAAAVAKRLTAPVVILDWSLPPMLGEDAHRLLATEAPAATVIVLSAFEGEQETIDRLGIAAWLSKTRLAELPDIVDRILAGDASA